MKQQGLAHRRTSPQVLVPRALAAASAVAYAAAAVGSPPCSCGSHGAYGTCANTAGQTSIRSATLTQHSPAHEWTRPTLSGAF